MKKFAIGLIAVVVVVLLFVAAKSSQENSSQTDKAEIITRLQDAHGLAVDREDPSRVYIATHTGLLAMIDDNEFVRVSEARDDYMGFSAHPTDANAFYSSGHPSRGGNIGFQKSTDGGKTWTKVSDGVNGPVDFHAMTVSQTNPSIIYGTYQGQLQRSTNEGKDWELVQSALTGIYTLTTSPDNENVVYAGTANGLQVSDDKGNTWESLGLDGTISSVAVNPDNSKKIVAYGIDAGLMETSDGGKSWQVVDGYNDDLIMYISYDPQNTDVIYAINQSLEIYKSTDGATTWGKVR